MGTCLEICTMGPFHHCLSIRECACSNADRAGQPLSLPVQSGDTINTNCLKPQAISKIVTVCPTGVGHAPVISASGNMTQHLEHLEASLVHMLRDTQIHFVLENKTKPKRTGCSKRSLPKPDSEPNS